MPELVLIRNKAAQSGIFNGTGLRCQHWFFHADNAAIGQILTETDLAVSFYEDEILPTLKDFV
jgi:hypothetical protein